MPRSGDRGLRFIDSHLHLSDYGDIAPILRFASSSGTVLVTAGIDDSSSMRGLSLFEAYPGTVRAFVGVHPSEAETKGLGDWFPGALERAVGAGEIGLDPKYSSISAEGAQQRVFRAQLFLAESRGKPVQVHSRGAEKECLEALETFRIRSTLLHWFQGEDLLPRAKDGDYYVSFGPALLVSKKLQRIARTWERERILVESDGPVGFSALGEVEGSWLIPSVVFKLAVLWGASFEDTKRLLLENSLRFLNEKA